MAEEKKDVKVEEKSVTVNDDKSPELTVKKETTVAPIKDESTEGLNAEALDKEAIDDTLMLLNIMDEQVGGKGGITEIPDALRNSIGYLVDQLTFVRKVWEDPQWKALLDDMFDQKEDGKTPSVEVAIARTFPLEKLQELADNEEYEGAQMELADNLASQKQTEYEDAMYDENFQKSLKAADEYAAEMGYDEERKNTLLKKTFDMYQIMADGILTKNEFAEIDKMINYDPDTSDLRAQLETQGAKEQLPDQASIESAISEKKPAKAAQRNTPGMASMNTDYGGVDVTQVGKRKRQR